MKIISALGALAIAALYTTDLLAAPVVFNNLSAANITTGGGTPQWTSGFLDLSSLGLSIGPSSSIQLQLNLDGNVTTAQAGGPQDSYGAGIVVSPDVAPNAEIFGFTYQLLENGVNVGSPFGFDLLNPFSFPVNNVGTGGGGEPDGVTFNRVDVTIYNNSLTEGVSSFQVYVGVPSVPSVPDTSSTLVLLTMGMLAIAGIGRKMTAVCRT